MPDPDIYRARVEREQHDIAIAQQMVLERIEKLAALQVDLLERLVNSIEAWQ